MKSDYNLGARKRAANLTLNEDLVIKARKITDNLSGLVETLLAEFLAKQRHEQAAKSQVLRATIETWNNFADKVSSFADEHSTL